MLLFTTMLAAPLLVPRPDDLGAMMLGALRDKDERKEMGATVKLGLAAISGDEGAMDAASDQAAGMAAGDAAADAAMAAVEHGPAVISFAKLLAKEGYQGIKEATKDEGHKQQSSSGGGQAHGAYAYGGGQPGGKQWGYGGQHWGYEGGQPASGYAYDGQQSGYTFAAKEAAEAARKEAAAAHAARADLAAKLAAATKAAVTKTAEASETKASLEARLAAAEAKLAAAAQAAEMETAVAEVAEAGDEELLGDTSGSALLAGPHLRFRARPTTTARASTRPLGGRGCPRRSGKCPLSRAQRGARSGTPTSKIVGRGATWRASASAPASASHTPSSPRTTPTRRLLRLHGPVHRQDRTIQLDVGDRPPPLLRVQERARPVRAEGREACAWLLQRPGRLRGVRNTGAYTGAYTEDWALPHHNRRFRSSYWHGRQLLSRKEILSQPSEKCLLYGPFPANAHPPGLGLSSPQPDTDHLARWVRFLAPRPWM